MEGVPGVVNHLRSLGQVQLATSVIVAGKLRFMAQNSEQKTANLIKIKAFLQRINSDLAPLRTNPGILKRCAIRPPYFYRFFSLNQGFVIHTV
jgi:hypothetical protein